MTPEDPVLAEVRAAREAILAEVGYDSRKLYDRVRERQEEARRAGRVILPAPPPAADRDAA